jgi:hypothetical protein
MTYMQLSQARDALQFIEEPKWTSPVKFDRSRLGKWKYGKIEVCRLTWTVTIIEENQSTGALSEWKRFSLDETISMNVVKVKLVCDTSGDSPENTIVLKPRASSAEGIAEFQELYEHLYGAQQVSGLCDSHQAKQQQQQQQNLAQQHTWWSSVQHWMQESPELVQASFKR